MNSAAPPGSTGIHALDVHFFSALLHHPSSSSSLRRGDVIEIQGPASSGKTHLLYELVSTCILPPNIFSIGTDGWDKIAIVFDTDDSFDVHRLSRLLQSRITQYLSRTASSLNTADSAKVTTVLTRILGKLRVFRPSSCFQLAASIANLSSHHATFLSTSEIGLVAIDSMSAFYWPDRFNIEQLRSMPQSSLVTAQTVTGAAASVPSLITSDPLNCVLAALHKFRMSHGPVTVLTNWGLNPSPNSTVKFQLFRQHLHSFPTVLPHDTDTVSASASHEFSNVCLPLTHHITLNFPPMVPYPADMVLPNTPQRDAHHCRRVEVGAQIVGLVRTNRSADVGTFCITITNDGVSIG
ncbi:hypothetical protein EW146_g587 [Bondarzewia mesenterica]|uniref:Uncharacterized protein n=1 Tax=Bondarzewia mesenterica TaxID=1095465 RepID=A0A4S4M6F4_9AGAM|nr:hypothetical protein EW146_g587 [Bondarzewia mesenterica]